MEGLGEVIVIKRRQSKNIRLSINSKGQTKVSIPTWVPYLTGLGFAKSRRSWIVEKQGLAQAKQLRSGDRIGKSHRLKLVESSGKTMSSRISGNQVLVFVPAGASTTDVQAAATRGSERALKAEAEKFLPSRTSDYAKKYGYKYKQVRIKKLTSRWGSCSSDKVISLSYYLMQLPWELIDYVIIHELTHTKHLNHGADFWEDMKKHVPKARQYQKWIRQHKPVVKGAK